MCGDDARHLASHDEDDRIFAAFDDTDRLEPDLAIAVRLAQLDRAIEDAAGEREVEAAPGQAFLALRVVPL